MTSEESTRNDGGPHHESINVVGVVSVCGAMVALKPLRIQKMTTSNSYFPIVRISKTERNNTGSGVMDKIIQHQEVLDKAGRQKELLQQKGGTIVSCSFII